MRGAGIPQQTTWTPPQGKAYHSDRKQVHTVHLAAPVLLCGKGASDMRVRRADALRARWRNMLHVMVLIFVSQQPPMSRAENALELEVIAQVGSFDGSPNEFGLAPRQAQQFQAEFPNSVVFRADRERFDIREIRTGPYVLLIALSDQQARGPFWQFEARVGPEWEMTPTALGTIKIVETRDHAEVSAVNREGLPMLRAELVHVPGPSPHLMFTCHGEPLGVFTVANLRRRPLPAVSRKETSTMRPAPEPEPRVILENNTLALAVDIAHGVLNPCELRDKRTEMVYADRPYLYRLGDDDSAPVLECHELSRDGRELTLKGRKGALAIEHRFRAEESSIQETVRITNAGNVPLDTSGFACGFTKGLGALGGESATAEGTLVPIPYRRDTSECAGTYTDVPASDLAWRKGYFWSSPGERVYTPAFGSEGWAWSSPGGTLLWFKYNPKAMEFALVEAFRRGDEFAFRFGGCGLWKRGDPEPAARLEPGQSFEFGVTRYATCEGGWKSAYYTFRDMMSRLGHRFPAGYNPPIHWNELYDNPLWWGPDTAERREQFYRLSDMEVEAQKAAELGCEALYLDPGWDTSFASTVWADTRLGRQQDFVKLLRDKYGLLLALHCPLAGWSDVNAFPAEARRKDASGAVLEALCSSAPAYMNEKAARLNALCDRGADFLMYDGSGYTGPCWDPAHGHSLPLTRHEHVMAYHELSRRVHERHPNVLIELHDPIVAGVSVRYAPTYFLHGLPGSFDELWGYEYMWDPMDDLLSGRAISLYYVNLAYEMPIYLHIDLRKDNAHALVFWWYASTCRHLGVGGKHPDSAVWQAHRTAMAVYRAHKRFYTQGTFWGLDETIHAHTLAHEGQCLLNVFNLADTAVEREIRFCLSDIGLEDQETGARVTITPLLPKTHIENVIETGRAVLWVNVPARGHQLVKISKSGA